LKVESFLIIYLKVLVEQQLDLNWIELVEFCI